MCQRLRKIDRRLEKKDPGAMHDETLAQVWGTPRRKLLRRRQPARVPSRYCMGTLVTSRFGLQPDLAKRAIWAKASKGAREDTMKSKEMPQRGRSSGSGQSLLVLPRSYGSGSQKSPTTPR